MKSTIVLSTYNGEKYIKEQMQSLLRQTRKPDEVLIMDDCSTDETRDIIARFIEENNLDWKLFVNEKNKGWKRNFFEGIVDASGDVIFPCDQDDIWSCDKIECMMRIMEDNQKIMVLEGKPHKFWDDKSEIDYNVRNKIRALLDKIDDERNKSLNSRRVTRKVFNQKFMRKAPGCTLAIRKEIVSILKDYWFDDMPHDALFTYFPTVIDGYYIYDCDVLEWRQHNDSTSKTKIHSRNFRKNEINSDSKILQLLLKYAHDMNVSENYIDIINNAIQWNEYRRQVVVDGNVLKAILLAGKMVFYTQKRRYFTDIKYSIGANNGNKK